MYGKKKNETERRRGIQKETEREDEIETEMYHRE